MYNQYFVTGGADTGTGSGSDNSYTCNTGGVAGALTGCIGNPGLGLAYLANTTTGTADATGRTTAFFADNDSLAMEVMKIIKGVGLKIPDDISIIGFDNDSLCEIIEPHLTTVHVFKENIGLLAVRSLVDAMPLKLMEVFKVLNLL